MAATEAGVWDLQDVRDKQLAGEWTYEAGGALWVWGSNTRGMFGLNQSQASLPSLSSPTQVGTDTSWYKFAKGDGSWTWQTGAVKTEKAPKPLDRDSRYKAVQEAIARMT